MSSSTKPHPEIQPAVAINHAATQTIKGKDAFIQQLLCDGIDTIFGNPGTVEEALIDTLPDYPEMKYIMGLQEAAVTGMADAYARATAKPAVVQVHASVGLGNAMGILYAAKQCYTPMVMYAGETYADLLDFYGFLGGDTVAIAKPVTKWADRVSHPSQLLRNLRRAVKIAMTPPQGPVFLAIPMNVLDSDILAQIKPTSYVDSAVLPQAETVEHIAKTLLNAKNPLLLIGDQVHLSGGQAEVHTLAELIGAPIYGCGYSQISASFKHPLFMGLTGFIFADRTVSITREADVIVALGTPLFPELFPTLEPYFAPDAKLIQVDLNEWELGKNFSTDTALRADPKLTLQAVISAIKAMKAPGLSDMAGLIETRKQAVVAQKEAMTESMKTQYAAEKGKPVMMPSEALGIIASHLPKNTAVFDESVTCIQSFLSQWQPENSDDYFMCRGGCLGQGLPGGIGLKLAYPDRPVVALSGDGAAMYTNQALWTAAHYKMDITFFILNNGTYRVLKTNLIAYWKRLDTEPRPFHNLDLSDPAINFVDLASSMGVQGYKVTTAAELHSLLADIYGNPDKHRGPKLIDVLIDGSIDPNAPSPL
ncbi:MAG: thiamine pyrophosphate-binding protein [Cyanobacteria bacterium P01_H01_bin.74]